MRIKTAIIVAVFLATVSCNKENNVTSTVAAPAPSVETSMLRGTERGDGITYNITRTGQTIKYKSNTYTVSAEQSPSSLHLYNFSINSVDGRSKGLVTIEDGKVLWLSVSTTPGENTIFESSYYK